MAKKKEVPLYDAHGDAVNLEALAEEKAAATITGIRTIWRESQASKLSPARLATILREADEGHAEAYLTLAEEMEEREPHYRSVLTQRKNAVSALNTVVESASDDAHDVMLADAIREQTRTPNFGNLKDDLLDALGKGYSVVEIMWDRTAPSIWPVKRFEWRDPRFFRFDRVTGQEIRLLDDKNPSEGLPLDPYKFIVHRPRLKTGLTVRGGLARVVAAAYMCKSYDVTDWMAFAEVFGMPLRLGRHNPRATDEEIRTLLRAVANIGTDAAAVVPRTMDIEFIDGKATAGGADVFERLAMWLDKQISKAVVGQTMTTDDGSSLAQSQVHNEVRGDIVAADARQLSNTLNSDFVRPYIDLNFGVQKRYPELCVYVPKPENLELLGKILPDLIDRGLPVQASVLLDKLGLPDPDAGAVILVPKASSAPADGAPPKPPTKPPTKAANNRRGAGDAVDELVVDGLADWEQITAPALDPLRKLVEEVKTLEELQARLPELAGALNSSELVHQLALSMFEARGLGNATDEVT